jgi:hypothetical protein
LGALIEPRLGGLGFVSLEERAVRDGTRAALKLVQRADTVVEELEGFNELVQGNLREPVVGNKEGVLYAWQRG